MGLLSSGCPIFDKIGNEAIVTKPVDRFPDTVTNCVSMRNNL